MASAFKHLSYAEKYRNIQKFVDLPKWKNPDKLGRNNKSRITRLFNLINIEKAEGKVFIPTKSIKRRKILNNISGGKSSKYLKGGWINFQSIGPNGKIKWNKDNTFTVISPELPDQVFIPVDAVEAAENPGYYLSKVLSGYPEKALYIPVQVKGIHKFNARSKNEFIRQLVKWFNAYDAEGVHDITQWFLGVKIIFIKEA